jgi:uncharacterized protein (DUF983 family)
MHLRRRRRRGGALTAIAYHPPQSAFGTGVACRCPRCGRGKLFSGYLTLASQCEVCQLDFGKADSGDGPAVFLILILGARAVLLAYFLLFVLVLPEWISWLILVVGVVGGALLLLRPAKAIMVALQYKNRSGEFGDG